MVLAAPLLGQAGLGWVDAPGVGREGGRAVPPVADGGEPAGLAGRGDAQGALCPARSEVR